MKLLIASLLISNLAWAQMPKLAGGAEMLRQKGLKVMAACKDDRTKMKGCDKYTEYAPLKDCLMKNKDALSSSCKKSLTE